MYFFVYICNFVVVVVYLPLFQSYRVWDPLSFPALSLRPQGLNNFKKYLKSCNKITSKEMGRGMGEGSGIREGIKKREPLPNPPPGFQPGQ